jgi:hypothetical protein
LRNVGAAFIGFIFILAGIFGMYEVTVFNASVPTWARSDFQSFDIVPALFPIIIGVVVLIYGLLPREEVEMVAQPPSAPPVIREVIQTEVVVKIRCSYYGTLYDETLDKCPNCGAKR